MLYLVVFEEFTGGVAMSGFLVLLGEVQDGGVRGQLFYGVAAGVFGVYEHAVLQEDFEDV